MIDLQPPRGLPARRLFVGVLLIQIAFISILVALIGPTVVHVLKLLARILEKAAA